MKRRISRIALGLLCAAPLKAAALGMDDYLDQVRQGAPSLRQAHAEDAAYALSAKEPLTAYSPQISGAVEHSDDQQAGIGATAMNPSDTEQLSWNADLGKLFSTGTQVDLGYTGDHTRMGYGSDLNALLNSFGNGGSSLLSGMLPGTDTYGQQFTVSVSQPLWRNFLAAQVEAGVSKANADADAARAQNRYQAAAVVFRARQAYANLVTLRQLAGIYRESLDRNKKILEWTQGKYADNLADKVDVLQCEAAVRQTELNLDQNDEDTAKAEALFNALRGATITAEIGDLEPLSAPDKLPDPKGTREDVAAAEAALRSSDAVVDQVVQRFTPNLTVFGSYSQGQRTPAADSDFEGYKPETVVGLRFDANLDYGLYRQVLKGAEQAKGGGEAAVADRKRGLEEDWAELRSSFTGVKGRLELARQLETLQKEKAEREKVRFEDGRTTNFQVLRYEDDYNLSRVQTLELTAQAVALEAQARYYNGDDRPW